MYKARLGGCVDGAANDRREYVETDPSGRYGRVSTAILDSLHIYMYRSWMNCLFEAHLLVVHIEISI